MSFLFFRFVFYLHRKNRAKDARGKSICTTAAEKKQQIFIIVYLIPALKGLINRYDACMLVERWLFLIFLSISWKLMKSAQQSLWLSGPKPFLPGLIQFSLNMNEDLFLTYFSSLSLALFLFQPQANW